MNANPAPINQIAKERISILFDQILPVVQARASSGSSGQGAFLALNCAKALLQRKKKETLNTMGLCSEIHINDGKVETNPTSVAPMPIETSNAGRAQQINVLKEVNNVRKGISPD